MFFPHRKPNLWRSTMSPNVSNNLPLCFYSRVLFVCTSSQIAAGSSRVCLYSQEQTGASGQLPSRDPWCLLLFGGILEYSSWLWNKVKLRHCHKYYAWTDIKPSSEHSVNTLYILFCIVLLVLSICKTPAVAQRCQFVVRYFNIVSVQPAMCRVE